MNSIKSRGRNMSEKVVLIAYSEIGLKSPPVRRALEHQLASHIAANLKREGMTNIEIRRIQGRLLVEGGDPITVAKIASQVFGAASALPSIRVEARLDRVIQTIVDVATQNIKDGQTFAVRSKRTGKHEYSSKDVQVKAGSAILDCLKSRAVKVNLTNPDVVIYAEVIKDTAYVYHQIFKGYSGMPYGSQGKLICLFSGGIDSPVAAWLMMKRGANVRLLFIDQRPFVGEDYYRRALKAAERLRQYVPLKNYQIYIVPAGIIMESILKCSPAKFVCVLCKRMMYRIACDLAHKVNASGIVTGENLGQVASQTLANLKVLDEISTLPVYRPLIGFEKMEIVALAKKIGTYETSTTPVDGCSVVPTKPATQMRRRDALEIEEQLPVDKLVTEALEKIIQVTV